VAPWIKAWLNFDDFLTTRILKLVYISVTLLILLAMVIGVLGGLAGCATAVRLDSVGGVATSLFMTTLYIVGGFLTAVIWRVYCEVLLVVFKINENIQALRFGTKP
jgi:hypothetical protein